MRDQQKRRRFLGQRQRQPQIIAAPGAGGSAIRFWGMMVLASLDGVDLDAYHGSVDLVMGQQRYSREVAAVFQVGIEQPLGRSRQRRGSADP